MKWSDLSRVILVGSLALIATARATTEDVSSDRSYQVIVERNPFNLREPPTTIKPAGPTNPPAKTNLKLTGFTTLRGKRAFFVLIDEKTKTNQPISLAIDQEVDGLRLLDVDPVNHRVRVTKDGVEKLMAFDTDGLTNAIVSAAAAGTPGFPGIQPVGGVPGINRPVPAPTVTPGSTSPNVTTPGFRSIPSRNLRTSTDSSAPQPIYAGAGSTGSGSTTRFTPVHSGSSTPPPTPQPDQDAVQQLILMEAQRALNPNLPPTPGLPPALPGTP
ncbi:MAG: hypothetical protein L0Z50_31660 [Verrucomicrobiales bacterium]|nr:hypothetical protein [Verrucomicrobiales bacterium]